MALACFALAVLGFSFWFFLAVPFASHRETYWWLATVGSHDVSHAFSFITSTWRPLFQVANWLGYLLLDPAIFPTRQLRQAAIQLFNWTAFAFAWWIISREAVERRTFALIACVAGGVFFSGYVQLFHVYGIAYIPVMLIVAALIRMSARSNGLTETLLASAAAASVFWHPFATALFAGWYFGRTFETWGERGTAGRVRAVVILLVCSAAVVCIVFLLPLLVSQTSALLRESATRGVGPRSFGLLVSYQTNEVNWIASVVAFLLTLAIAWGTPRVPLRGRVVLTIAILGASAAFVSIGWPLVLLWVLAAVVKLAWMRCWSLAALAATATMLPFGGGIGTPIHVLFAIALATYATALGWQTAERRLAFVGPRSVGAAVTVAALLVLGLRSGLDLPVLSRLAMPLLAERERTYQGEQLLVWLHGSPHCERDIEFVTAAGNPVDSLESVIDRRYRPPASIEDMRLYWRTALRCPSRQVADGDKSAVILTFGGPTVPGATPVHAIPGRYAGPATVWILDPS